MFFGTRQTKDRAISGGSSKVHEGTNGLEHVAQRAIRGTNSKRSEALKRLGVKRVYEPLQKKWI